LTTDRQYKPAFAPDYAVNILRDECAKGWRDPRVVEAFCDTMPRVQSADSMPDSSLLALSVALGKSEGVENAPKKANDPVLTQLKPLTQTS
jgi:hypothetical protein